MARALGFCVFESAIGTCGIAWTQDALAGVQLPEASTQRLRERMQRRFPGAPEAGPPAHAAAALQRVQALLAGARDDLADIALDMEGAPAFQQRVWVAARAIPPGTTVTYGELAARLGEPGASRAVGQALGLNPFAPVVPCHRVLAAGGGAGGFSAEGGTGTKLRLLEIERARMPGQPGLFDC